MRLSHPSGVLKFGGLPNGALSSTIRFVADPLETLVDWTTSATEGLISVPVPVPGYRFLVATHPEIVEQVLVKQHKKFKKSYGTALLEGVLGQGLLTSSGEHWKRQRKLARPAFHVDSIRSYADTMARHTLEMLESWPDAVEIDAQAEMMKLTFTIVCETLFGAAVHEDAEAMGRAMEVVLEAYLGFARTGLRFPDWVPTRSNRHKRAAQRTIDDLMHRIISDRAQEGASRTDLLGMLMSARDDEGRPMSHAALKDEAVTLILAGHETTSAALTLTQYLLALHPDVMTRLQAEVDSLGHVPGFDDLPSLPYTERVLKESLRLYPPGWALGREAREGCSVSGYALKKRDQVWMVAWAIQRDPRWFDDPLAFNPDRWTDGLEQRLPPCAYFPFGGGPRNCIGKRFAMMEATIVLASLVQAYSWRLPPDYELDLLPSVTLRPKGGMPLILTRRSGTRQ